MRQLFSLDLLAIIFSLGCLPLMFLPSLPSYEQWYMLAIVLITFILIVPSTFYRFTIMIAVLILSFLWSTAYSHQYLSNVEPYIDKTLVVQAKVETIDVQADNIIEPYYIKFALINSDQHYLSFNPTISVYWDQPIIPKAGQIWQLTLKTKVSQGYLNEGGFDSQRFAIANRRLLSAKLKQAKLLDDKRNVRQVIADYALPYINLCVYRGILIALAFGERTQISGEDRLIMMQTGIAHLMAISGMHILLVFYFCCFIVKTSLFLVPNRYIHYFVPIIVGWLSALFYAWLTGFNPPTLRAIFALSIWIYLRYQSYHLSAWQKINRIIAILLLFDPLMILSESFWLSCYAVISLLFLSQWMPLPNRFQQKKRWYLIRLLHLQFGLTLLLLPIQFFIFHGISTVALFTNLIAIPLITLCTFPAILLALLFSLVHCFYLSLWFCFVADSSLKGLFLCLKAMNVLWLTLPANFYLLSLIGWLMIIVIHTELWRHFFVTILSILCLMISPFFVVLDYVWRVDMLDVGHGLAIVIHNGKSAILYDTGAKWDKNSVAEQVIIPFLLQHNLTVEGIIISHQHNDHIGGLNILKRTYPNAWLMSSSSSLNNDYLCLAGNHISWNQLSFNILWPKKLVNYAQNKDSCVIQITDGRFSVLLTGDLERTQEYQLIEQYGVKLSSTFLQVPHHGSMSSSSYAFINRVKPKSALVSTSRYNAWNLPADKITLRYHELNIDYHVTARTGQISLFFNKLTWNIKTMREQVRPRWYHDWLGRLPIYE